MSLAHLAMLAGIDAGESSALDAERMRQFRWPSRCRSIDKRLHAELAKKRNVFALAANKWAWQGQRR